jgi:transposase-like protein
MMAANKRRRWKADEWREAFGRQARSGLSVLAFCAQESINPSSFYRWRGLSSDPQEAKSGGGLTTSEVSPVQARARRTQSEFVDLGSLGTSRSRVELRLDLGDGLLLTLVRS